MFRRRDDSAVGLGEKLEVRAGWLVGLAPIHLLVVLLLYFPLIGVPRFIC